MRAAEIAGLKVLRLISEPTAAVIAYMNKDENELNGKTVMVFDLGGGRNTYSIELHKFLSMLSLREDNRQKLFVIYLQYIFFKKPSISNLSLTKKLIYARWYHVMIPFLKPISHGLSSYDESAP